MEDQIIDDKINAPNPQGRKKTVDKKGEKDDEAVAVKETFPPVPLLQLYRFSTRFEIFFEHYRLHWDFELDVAIKLILFPTAMTSICIMLAIYPFIRNYVPLSVQTYSVVKSTPLTHTAS